MIDKFEHKVGNLIGERIVIGMDDAEIRILYLEDFTQNSYERNFFSDKPSESQCKLLSILYGAKCD